MDRNESESRYLRIHHRKRREVHLLRRLPPSITESTLAIYYTYLLSHSISPQPSFAKRQYLNLDPQVSGLPEPLPWQIDVGLLSGPLLYVNQPIPLTIRLTKLCEENCKSRLNEFQTMLIETTQARAHGSIETLDRFWTVQTVANMKQMLYAGDTSAESVFEIPDCLGFPPTITANDPKFRNMQHQADIRGRTSSGLNNWISSSKTSGFIIPRLWFSNKLQLGCHSGILRPRLHRGGKIPRDLVAAKFFLTELAKFTASTESRLSRKGLWPWILEGDWLMPRLDGKGHLPTEPVSFVMDAPTRRLGDYVGGCCCRS